MKAEIVIIGMGQLGRVFAEAFLVMGHPVVPVLRGMDLSGLAAHHPAPRLVLVATGEDDLPPLLDTLPASWRSRLGLLQNELLPMHWMAHGVETPTVVPVWFEKKAGKPVTPLMPSPVFGPAAPLVAAALERVGIPVRLLEDEEALLYALVLKNLYILVTNIAGLKVGGDTGTLRERHWDLVEGLGGEILAIQEGLTGARLHRPSLMADLACACLADPRHGCAGRSASARLRRTIRHAERLGLVTPHLVEIARCG